MKSRTQIRYECRYNPDLYDDVESHIMIHVYTFTLDNPIQREMYLAKPRPSNMLEAVIHTAKQMVGMSGYHAEQGFNRLMMTSLIEQIPLVIVEAIATFLKGFESPGDTIATDYQHTLKTLYKLQDTDHALLTGIQSASVVHGVQGQFAYELLTTAQHLMMTTQAVLKNDPSYATEKFAVAKTHMRWANLQAHRYHPNKFSKP